MGIDKSLSDRYPSVIINGSRYHYGREDKHGQYLVEHESYAKDYWVFKEREDLEAFLINLPESADRNLRLNLHPDWRDVTPEQRDVYFEEDKLLFRSMAADRLAGGKAQSFNTDFEGKHGPHDPQYIEPRPGQDALARIYREIDGRRASMPGLSEAGKLRLLEGNVDWTGIDGKQKEAILGREIEFSKITREALNFVYEDVADDKYEAIDERPGRRLFDQANHAQAVAGAGRIAFDEQLQKVRDTTRNLIESAMLDTWPRPGAVVDFGIDSQQHYEALYYPLRNDEIAPSVLDAAMGHGEKLTELVRAAPSNPHKNIEFYTSWDEVLGRERPAGKPAESAGHPRGSSPGDLAQQQREPDSAGPDRGMSKGRRR